MNPVNPAEVGYPERAGLPIGQGQTISQPFIIAYMMEIAEIDPGSYSSSPCSPG